MITSGVVLECLRYNQNMDEIPDTTGKICEALLKQEFWHEGAKIEDISVLFLKVRDGAWHRFFFDCGPLFWKIVEAPDVWNTTPADSFHYPQTEIGSELGIIGQLIESAELHEATGFEEVRLQFENGTLLVLHHLYPQDTTTLLIEQRR
jgi:hypothetical protein